MEYLLVQSENSVVGGLRIDATGAITFNMPTRAQPVLGVAFGESNSWTVETLAKRINNHGRAVGGANWKDLRVVPAFVPAGCFYPRISRPTVDHPDDPPSAQGLGHDDRIEMQQSKGQLKSLVSMLEDIVEVVQPERANSNVFGPKIRNLLILASTEFEAAAKSVLRKNRYGKEKTSIQDYEKTQKAMRLSQYRVSFEHFPGFESVRPFEAWGERRHLEWYRAYNNSKHDRHLHQAEANLENAMFAVAGCFSFLVASYGWRNIYGFGENLGLGLRIVDFPQWDLGHLYRRAKSRRIGAGPYDAQDIDTATNYPFNA